MDYRVGVDLGGTKMLLALAAGDDGEVIRLKKVPTRAREGPQSVLRRLIGNIEEILSDEGLPFNKLEGIGLCIAGFYDIRSRQMISSPNLPGWEMFPLERELKERLHLPIIIENDANAAAYGEFVFGAGRGTKNMVNITLGTGIGGGIIVEGKIYRGSGGFAGEIGHLNVLHNGPLCGCGRYGCVESLSSGSAIEREWRLISSGNSLRPEPGITMETSAGLQASQIFAAARDGNPDAIKIVERAAYYFGLALSYVVNILNPEMIVVGGGLAGYGDFFIDRASCYLNEAAISPSGKMAVLVPAELGEEAGVKGVLSLLDELLKGR
ncbi:MAG: ROK family protein [Dethiobacteria bacterium]|jgi:glucokinase